ncbi:MAG: hypothetical protein JWP22_2305 [Ramlibacter sp.]|jgi:hypothetical protein|nr:hypothetical protein [Ramlibacter sp.]
MQRLEGTSRVKPGMTSFQLGVTSFEPGVTSVVPRTTSPVPPTFAVPVAQPLLSGSVPCPSSASIPPSKASMCRDNCGVDSFEIFM